MKISSPRTLLEPFWSLALIVLWSLMTSEINLAASSREPYAGESKGDTVSLCDVGRDSSPAQQKIATIGQKDVEKQQWYIRMF